jgi:hypothetical protein
VGIDVAAAEKDVKMCEQDVPAWEQEQGQSEHVPLCSGPRVALAQTAAFGDPFRSSLPLPGFLEDASQTPASKNVSPDVSLPRAPGFPPPEHYA